jgi:hypothetical protein
VVLQEKSRWSWMVSLFSATSVAIVRGLELGPPSMTIPEVKSGSCRQC